VGLFDSDGRWQGFLACPLTPYDADGRVDADVYAAQIEFLLAHGAPALCALMHMAESLNLSWEERRLLASLTVEVAGDRAPVVVHVSCPGTDHTVELARHAESAGAKGVVAVTPYHWRPGEEGLLQHFMAVAKSIEGALVAYTFPAALGVSITPELAASLIERAPNFLAIKEASHHLPTFAELAQVAAELRPELSVFSGVDYMLANRVCGGAGTFSACAVVAPRLVGALWEAVANDDLAGALPIQDRVSRLLGPLLRAYPATIKAAAEIMGRPLGPTRLPTPPLSAGQRAGLAVELDRAGLLDDEPYGWDPGAGPDPERARRQAGITAPAVSGDVHPDPRRTP